MKLELALTDRNRYHNGIAFLCVQGGLVENNFVSFVKR
jgi:hypothetical protein